MWGHYSAHACVIHVYSTSGTGGANGTNLGLINEARRLLQ